MPELSVLMPVRDAEDHVAQALRSVKRDLPRDAEVVVLDDGSTDGSRRVLERYTGDRVRVLDHPGGLGVGGALQHLLDASDSRYVARMDADDLSLPGRFRSQRRHVLSGDCDFSFGSIVRFGGRRQVRPGLPAPIRAEAMPLHLAVHNPLCHPTMFARRDAVVAAGGYRRVRAEDHDLWLRAVTHGFRLARMPWPVLAYRQHDAQVSTQGDWVHVALSEPTFRATYRDFTRAALDRDGEWVEALWPVPGQTPSRDAILGLRRLEALLTERSATLSVGQRAVLRRTRRHLRRRIQDVRAD